MKIILDFVLGVLAAYYTSYRIMVLRKLQGSVAFIAAVILIVALTLCFIIFTFNQSAPYRSFSGS